MPTQKGKCDDIRHAANKPHQQKLNFKIKKDINLSQVSAASSLPYLDKNPSTSTADQTSQGQNLSNSVTLPLSIQMSSSKIG